MPESRPLQYPPSSKMAWPLDNELHARLFHHFISTMARWFDVCDPGKHFARHIPVRAMKSPILLGAMLSLSAWHLSMVSDVDARVSDQLYGESLNAFISTIADSPSEADESLFVATIILHNVEEVKDPSTTKVSHGHLVAMNHFLDRQPSFDRELHQAALNVSLRQEVTFCMLSQKPPGWPTSKFGIDRSLSEADDTVWALRIVAIAADVLAFCLGDENRSLVQWADLDSQTDQWLAVKPTTFAPFYCREASPESGEYLPTVWHFQDCHALASIHYYICKILLAIYDPKHPKLGFRKLQADKRVNVYRTCPEVLLKANIA
ncbi:hypothetical protein BDY21DRAFT_287665 [Lineolata rhizophorae]|uniref:Uncharacterized protein n=1 Tax=Lineolata rhizophorae TaxID=578093 RepID=A0A6A6NXH7_9PEZI|nr:hypothetical protein BDY21DRAFT_287665 [Lineolata rhizophorae]